MKEDTITKFISCLKHDKEFALDRCSKDKIWRLMIYWIVFSNYNYFGFLSQSETSEEFIEFIDGNGFRVSNVGTLYGYKNDHEVIRIYRENNEQ